MNKSGQIHLRELLQKAQSELGDLSTKRHKIEKEIERLKSLIIRQKERCQLCRGRGTTKERDNQSGYEFDSKCFNCNGTGFWEEPL